MTQTTPRHDDDGDVIDDWREDPWDSSNGAGEVERTSGSGKRATWMVYAAVLLVTGLILAGGVYGWWYIRQAKSTGDPGPITVFVVAEGETLDQVSDRLEDEGFISNASFFRSYVDSKGGIETIEPGRYTLRPGDHVGNIMKGLATSPSESIARITFPEGFTLQQMANRLAASEDLPQFDADAFMAAANDPTIPSLFRPADQTSLEGLLFPATYEVSNADTERQIIERMVANMEYVGSQLDITQVTPEIGMLAPTPYHVLIVASIIEREAATAQDRPLIARVIYNRLAAGMPLQIDATLLYQVDPATGIDPDDLQPGDIDRLQAVPGPYNSYLNVGLPPTPIANPGRASIEAALHPANNPSPGEAICSGVPNDECRYLYYVLADEQGNHAFSVTAEQQAARTQEAFERGLLGAG